jgi:DNA-binding beta-propeller fold protein YncE
VRTRVSTGSAPRSLTIAPDGKEIYVVNYDSGTVTKLRRSDLNTLP